MLERLFRLKENGTDVRTEVIAGVTTFMTMAYILFVNPDILSTTGMPFGAVMTPPPYPRASPRSLQGLWRTTLTPLPAAWGLTRFAFVVAAQAGWQAALGAVFCPVLYS